MAPSSPQIDWEAPRASDSPFLQGLRVVRDLPRRADGGGRFLENLTFDNDADSLENGGARIV